jgi:DNA-binding transcriptional LysR family regulator
MLNDNTVDFLSDNIDCAIRVGAEVDPATVSVLLAEVPRCVVASPELLAKYPPLTSLGRYRACRGSPFNTFYQHEVGSASGKRAACLHGDHACLSTDSVMSRVIPRWRGWGGDGVQLGGGGGYCRRTAG